MSPAKTSKNGNKKFIPFSSKTKEFRRGEINGNHKIKKDDEEPKSKKNKK